METMDKMYFKKLAHQLMFDLNDQEIEELQEDFTVLLEQIQLLDKIDTENVSEMVYPFEASTSFLREDVVQHTISQEEALEGAKSVIAGHVHVPKVVR